MAEHQKENDEESSRLTELHLDDFVDDDCGEPEEPQSRNDQGFPSAGDTAQLLTPTSNPQCNLSHPENDSSVKIKKESVGGKDQDQN